MDFLLYGGRGISFYVVFCYDNFVNLVMTSDPLNQPWLLSLVYGPTYMNEKEHFWYELEQRGLIFEGPWYVLATLMQSFLSKINGEDVLLNPPGVRGV